MTRLRTSDIDGIGAGLAEHDRYLVSATGLALGALARLASGFAGGQDAAHALFCVVPITSGKGLIPRFAQTVRDILVHVGFEAVVSPEPDGEGLAYARRVGARVTLWADDDRFVAEMDDGQVIDNIQATALAYVTGLERLANGLAGRPVLLLGCGSLGCAMADALYGRGGALTVHDPVAGRAQALAARTGAIPAASFEQAVLSHDLILVASDAPEILHRRHVSSRTCVSAPGMPCGVEPAAREALQGRLLHDPLQLGVATMAFMAFRKLVMREGCP